MAILMRRNIIRYVLLSYCMATRAVSFRVKKRFLVDAGLMQEDEYKVSKHKIFLSLNSLKILSFSFGRF